MRCGTACGASDRRCAASRASMRRSIAARSPRRSTSRPPTSSRSVARDVSIASVNSPSRPRDLPSRTRSFDFEAEDRERIGSMMGSALGGVGYAEEQFLVFKNEGIKSVSATLATNVFAGAASCNVAIEFGAQGPNSTNAMSCASGTMAIGEGFRQIRDGYADVMICGGAEAPLNQLCFGAFAIIRAMSTRNDDPAARVTPVRP